MAGDGDTECSPYMEHYSRPWLPKVIRPVSRQYLFVASLHRCGEDKITQANTAWSSQSFRKGIPAQQGQG